MRRIVGTELIGAKGATEADQDKINGTVVRLGRAKIYTPDELSRHGKITEAPTPSTRQAAPTGTPVS